MSVVAIRGPSGRPALRFELCCGLQRRLPQGVEEFFFSGRARRVIAAKGGGDVASDAFGREPARFTAAAPASYSIGDEHDRCEAFTAEGQIVGFGETGTVNDDLRIDRPEQEMILILWANLARVGEPEQIEFIVSGFATRSGGNRRGKWLC